MAQYREHFEDLYRQNDDPWDYQNSPYERAKYDATLAALTRKRYASALEVGCSIGVLSARLAPRCERLLALDLSHPAINAARERLTSFPNATAKQAILPLGWIGGRYDLILLSELIYYLSATDIATLAERVAQDAVPGAECVIVHYQGETETELTPDAARQIFCDALSEVRVVQVTDHPSPAEYNHRTVMIGGPAG